MLLKYFILFSTLIIFIEAYKSYEGYKVYDVVPKNEAQVQILLDLRKEGYDYWTDVFNINNNVRIMVAPEKHNEFVTYLEKVGLNPSISINNVQQIIRDQLKPSEARSDRSNTLGSLSWTRYHSLSEIHAWLDELVELYPNVVQSVNIGTSNEGRPIKGVIIDFKRGNRETPPLVAMIEGGIHSREWISPATVTWIIKEFLTSSDQEIRHMAESFIWHIFPITNPDGYVYTFSNIYGGTIAKSDWGGTTALPDILPPNSSVQIRLCSVMKGNNASVITIATGASSDPCTQTFAGPTPASEPETRAIANYVLNLKETGNVIYYFAFHSYSQMILVPYSHVAGSDVLQVENYADLFEIAIRGAEKLTARHGTPYTVGTSAEILYEVSGSSFDWVKGVADIPIVYLFELRDLGQYGFLLPPEDIIANNEEIMDCLVEMDRTTRQLGYYSASNVIVSSLATLVFGIVFLFFN